MLLKRITAAIAAALMLGTLNTSGASALTTGVNATLSSSALATLTAMSGQVFKRDFVDWEKEVWGEPAPATVNDQLREGMQIGTGNNSWAEVSWPNVKTRAWSNTVFAVAPNKRLVYLTGGEMLFRLDKHRKDKDQAYYIWTKVLQARIRGTTVLVQAKGPITRFTVMEGVVEITNRLDHSRATLRPGVVYEIVGYKAPSTGVQSYKPHATLSPNKIRQGDMTNIFYDKQDEGRQPVFRDQYTSTNVYVSNNQALLHHPLLTAGGEIDSLPLIEREQQGLPGQALNLTIPLAESTRNKVVAHSMNLEAVPANADYFIGKNVRLPQIATAELMPKGTIVSPMPAQTVRTAMVTPQTAPPAVPFALGCPALPPEAQGAGASISAQKEDLVQPDPVQEFNTAPATVNGVPTDVANPAASAFQTVSGAQGALTNAAALSGITGNVAGANIQGAVAGAAAAVNGVSSVNAATAGLSGMSSITSTVAGVSSVAGTSTLTNTMTGTLAPVTNLTHTLTNVAPSINSLLGH